jgi:hypothetical protein
VPLYPEHQFALGIDVYPGLTLESTPRVTLGSIPRTSGKLQQGLDRTEILFDRALPPPQRTTAAAATASAPQRAYGCRRDVGAGETRAGVTDKSRATCASWAIAARTRSCAGYSAAMALSRLPALANAPGTSFSAARGPDLGHRRLHRGHGLADPPPPCLLFI